MNPDMPDNQRLTRIHEAMAVHIERGTVPGIVLLLSQRGDVHVDLLGTKGVGDSERISRDTIFRISSMTKPIIAVATMQYIEDGILHLNEPVERLLPELADRHVLRRLDGPLTDTVPAQRSITVQDLLTFRLGFGQLPAAKEAYPILMAADEQQIGMGPPSPATTPAPHD
jgi:CubicO group peptidase (beta-lactamase class C family)